MSERDTLGQVTAERDHLAGLVAQHEAQLRTFSADLQHVLLANFSGEDMGTEYVGAWQRLHALIAPVTTGYGLPDEAMPAPVARIDAPAAPDQDSSADARTALEDPHHTYALNVTLVRGDAALFHGHRFAHARLSQILSSYRELVLRHMPQFTPDEWTALAEMLNDECNEAHYDYLQRLNEDERFSDHLPHGPWTTDVDRLAGVVADRAAERTAQQQQKNAEPLGIFAPTVDLLDLAARLSALTDVQRLATYEKLMPLLYPERCDLVAYDEAHNAAMDAAITELLNTTR
ncbi:hypothetical protein [Xanthomonas vesicatoria]|uniref:Uncharacterized protein n=1 Tax=Xanthomonas vesicatoria TaxID=56460 RepID=A0ABS8L475_9XANT|nr:hypothetical protein [Xanthomonas vesicatoria]APO93311.1 hypothetical protein BI313_00670 [Xanthomonas vesicatoria]MCC8620514.1 hypothetical protein [Xanthomonas vesicatoria]MDG4491471.1 hypothetical protein [Xanthomonas vesicatoria]